MDARSVRIHSGAAADYAEAYAWYASRSRAVGFDFEREVERGLRLIAASPTRWPHVDRTHRRLVVRKFPYLIIYRLMRAGIVVVAVAHGMRRPGYWRRRSAR